MEMALTFLVLLAPAIVGGAMAISSNRNLEKPERLYVETLLMCIPGFLAAASGVLMGVSASLIMSVLLLGTIGLGVMTIRQAHTVGKRRIPVSNTWISPVYVGLWMAAAFYTVIPSVTPALYLENIHIPVGLGYLMLGFWNTFRIIKMNKRVQGNTPKQFPQDPADLNYIDPPAPLSQ